MKRVLPFVVIVAVLGGALLMARYWNRSTTETPRATPAADALAKPPVGPVRLGAEPPHALGNPNAPVMLEEFGDFECPPCGLLHPVLKTTKGEFGQRLVLVFRQFPMVSLHAHALAAARAAEAAGLQGKFWEMHDLLYENQRIWHDAADLMPIFAEYATKIGLDLDRFKQDVTNEVVDQRIRLDQERGQWIGVNGTPTVFLNGREIPLESLTPEKLRVLINAQAPQ
jgi:protein-disulfide isomerase